jgi:hypothetical protein
MAAVPNDLKPPIEASTFYRPIIPLNEIVEILAAPHLAA